MKPPTSLDISNPAPQAETSVKTGSQKLAYLLLLIFGVTLIILGAYARYIMKESWIPELCIAGGVALAAPGILSYLYRKYMLDEIKIELQRPAQEFKQEATKIIDTAVTDIADRYRDEIEFLKSAKSAGIHGVYISRAEAVEKFLPFIEDEKHEILLLGSSLRGLLQEFDSEYEHARQLLKRKKDEGVRLRFLLTHPLIADLRAKQENREFKDIGKEILKSLATLLNEWKIEPEHLKLYLGTPTCFGIKTAKAMLLNTYPYMKEAFASPCLIIKKPGYFYEHFLSSHFKA